jgi:MFS transporter, ACS family, glucarate transporter
MLLTQRKKRLQPLTKMVQPVETLQPVTAVRPTRVRHIVLGLTVAAYMITYMDRVVISSATPSIRQEFGFSLVTIGWIIGSFRWSYALFQIPGGWLGDWIGPRRALALVVTWWSAFTSLTGLAWSATSMAVCRFLFGMGEAGAFPIATRSLSRWMLPSERGFAQGITHAGSRLGAALTPPLVVMLIAAYGWRAPFFAFGTLGIAWAIVWNAYYRDTPEEHSSVNASERSLIHGATGARPKPNRNVPWRDIFSSPTLWYLSLMYFCYGYCLAVYLDWFPTYLKEHRGFTLKQMGAYASLPLIAGTLGDLLGGWSSDRLLHRLGVNRSRRLIAVLGFLIAAFAIVPATLTRDPMLCVWLTCIAVFGLEVTVGVSWALPLDIGGDFAGSVSSVMNMCGNIGGAISPILLAYLVTGFGWEVPFLVPSVLCLIGAALFLKIDATKRIFADGT